MQDLLKLPTREAHSFVGELFRCEDLLKACLPPVCGHSAWSWCTAFIWLGGYYISIKAGSARLCGIEIQVSDCDTLHRLCGQVGYGFLGDLRAIEARLGCVAAAKPAVDLASLHRVLAVRGRLQLPRVGPSLFACVLVDHYAS